MKKSNPNTITAQGLSPQGLSPQETYEMAQDQLIMACEDLANQAQKDQAAFQRATAEVAACLYALKSAKEFLN